MQNLTITEAYTAMYSFLEELYLEYGHDQLGGLLGSMSLLAGGTTADPAIWSDWLSAIEKTRAGKVDIHLRLGNTERSE